MCPSVTYCPLTRQVDKHAVAYVPRAVFGVTLEESLDIVQIANLPAVVFRCIQYLEDKKADQEEGIYRLSGSSAVIKNLKDMFNQGSFSQTLAWRIANLVAEGDIDLLASDEYWDPHAIAGLLKSYLRELPASILTRELHLQFLSVIGMPYSNEFYECKLTTLDRLRGSTRTDQGALASDRVATYRQLQPPSRPDSTPHPDCTKLRH